MPFIVGIALVASGAIVAWGGISGRLAKMFAALLPPGRAASTSADFSAPDTGFQQLDLGGEAIGEGSGGAPASSPPSGQSSNNNNHGISYLVPNVTLNPTTGQSTGGIPNPVYLA